MQSVILTMIDKIKADRPRWKPDEESVTRSWSTAFIDIESDILLEATDLFLKEQKGSPTIEKLWKPIQKLRARKGSPGQAFQIATEAEMAQERKAIEAECERVGDPVRGYLIRYGLIQPTKREAEVLKWAKHMPCRPNYAAPAVSHA